MRRWLERRAASFDLIHLFDARTLQSAWASARAVAEGVPFVVSVWGSLPRGQGWRALVKAHYDARHLPRQLGRAAALLAQNEHEAALFGAYGGDPARVRVWPLAVDPADLADLPPRAGFRRQHGIAADERVALFVGRLAEAKGLDTLIDAFARAAVPRARLVVVGRDDGWQAQMLAHVRRRGIADRFTFAGPLYGREALAAYVDCDLFCLLPHHFEETSLASLTAAACGRPVLINDRCAIPWLHDYDAGRCVPHELPAVAAALADLLPDRARLERMGAAGRRMVDERFLLPRIVDQLEGIYHQARRERALPAA
jgi:glycosyltransferase involved in cell wall biosynthesis